MSAPRPQMYVWRAMSALRDYGDGLLCVIATSEAEAIELAVDALCSPMRDQLTFRTELTKHAASGDPDVYEIIERGATYLRGSS